jgi:CubicO group peptidase (beta-lactamase class C family)
MRELRNVVAVARQTYQIPGRAVAVTVPGEGCWVSASGLANTTSGAPLQLSDEFPIASITKTFTATVILQLVQQGKLSLSAPLSRWLPYVQHARRITIKMLLGMTSGIYSEPAGQLAQQMAADPGQVDAAAGRAVRGRPRPAGPARHALLLQHQLHHSRHDRSGRYRRADPGTDHQPDPAAPCT